MQKGLKINHTVSQSGSPWDSVEWVTRTTQIKGDDGKVLFEQENCVFPKQWSQLAANVVSSKYFYGAPGTAQRENSVKQVIDRVTSAITDWGRKGGYFETEEDAANFYAELSWLCLHQHGAFNSPVWFNVGLFEKYGVTGDASSWVHDEDCKVAYQPKNSYEYPQGSACFIQSVEDNMESIMDLAASEASLFKFGSGTGTDLSTIRSKLEKLSGGGTPSGPLSFMRIFDQIAAVVKSGGKTRRAAKMQSLKVSHPDIMDFITCKRHEELKAFALIREGYEANFNGEAYSSVLFQNSNLSVRLTEEFMGAYMSDGDWQTTWVSDKATGDAPKFKAREIMYAIAENAWLCGDPGVQFDTTINDWHTCPQAGRINASNPCSEYMFLDDTACNLASINLMKYMLPNGGFDVAGFERTCRIFIIAQDIIVGNAGYPTARIAKNSFEYRPLGLGYANLGALIMANGVPYDSDAATDMCGCITAIMHGAANLASCELAECIGPFERYYENKNDMLAVIGEHAAHAQKLTPFTAYTNVAARARSLWDEVMARGAEFGFRNSQVTVLAPTGTISFMMDCDTTGIEPDIALVKYKQLAGRGSLKIVNQTVGAALERLGYSDFAIKAIMAYIDANDTVEGCSALKSEHLPVFDCAFTPARGVRSIQWKAHIKMMAAAQPFLSGAISKTVNMPNDATVEDVVDAYILGWRSNLKALAIYRDGSKGSQPLNTKASEPAAKKVEVAEVVYLPAKRNKLPDTRSAVTHKFNISGHEGYITVGLYENGTPGELFITMAKEGSTIGGLMDSFGTATSIALQYGVPLETMTAKFIHTRFEPSGHTTNPEIKIAKSIIDYIFRWLSKRFLEGETETPPPVATKALCVLTQSDAPACTECGSITSRNGKCYLCHNCGTSLGCS